MHSGQPDRLARSGLRCGPRLSSPSAPLLTCSLPPDACKVTELEVVEGEEGEPGSAWSGTLAGTAAGAVLAGGLAAAAAASAPVLAAAAAVGAMVGAVAGGAVGKEVGPPSAHVGRMAGSAGPLPPDRAPPRYVPGVARCGAGQRYGVRHAARQGGGRAAGAAGEGWGRTRERCCCATRAHLAERVEAKLAQRPSGHTQAPLILV
jgi:hypothetical protein